MRCIWEKIVQYNISLRGIKIKNKLFFIKFMRIMSGQKFNFVNNLYSILL